MHFWHHAKHLPEGSHGVNYGISLSPWGYLFGNAYIHNENEPLGFNHIEEFPKTFWSQTTYPWNK
jgi:sterol desaturase/sphingolipid hydroxylase (fatty acid hydroxylase superfamily)